MSKSWWWVAAVLGCLAGCASNSGRPVDATPPDASDAGTGRPDAGSDGGPMDTGPDGGLEQVGYCEACVVHEQCGPTGRCVQLTDGEFACAAVCNPDIPSCPRGFECVVRPASPDLPVCAPIGERCCIDADADGYGLGVGCEGPDCDDDSIDINPGVTEVCNGVDDDCDGATDEEFSNCGEQQCRTAGMGYEEVAPGSCSAGSCVEGAATSCGMFACELGGDEGDRCATTCTIAGEDNDAACILSAHCDLGVCVPDVPNGGVCDEDSDCEAGHCDNGFCCDGGTCCNDALDCPGGGGIGATCDDTATCQGTRGEIICEMFQCTTRSGVPDDSACDSSVEANDCGFGASIYCTGEVNQTPPSCPGRCTDDSECDPGAHCDVACVPDLDDGSVCDEDSDCVSGYCNNNICCSGGDCCRTPSDCPSSYSSAPTCDTPSACQGTRDAATCSDFVCGTAANVPDDSACTASTVASDCGLYPTRFCSGGTDQTPPVCASNCTSDAECDASAHCDMNMCLPDLDDGQACDEDSDCRSGHCQNGFCCASGDCCSTGSDCPSSTYGEPPICLSATSCQGQRRDPACNATHQCQLGPTVDDDSGCDGLVSNTCGLYPSVSCTSATTQPTDQMGLCATSCVSDADCDAGAFCNGSNECEARGAQGDACVTTGQCQAGLQCVDGVCCTSSCTAGCMACNVPGSEGTCSFIPSGQDPAGECGGVNCNGYYHGWSGDRCFDKADAPASAVACDGAGACQTAADVCPSQGQGEVVTDCDDLCQTINAATCSGTNIGTCQNITPSPATQTCGIGACQRTTNRCNAGTQVSCTPGAPSAETCNDIDDNCNGVVDDGLSGDGYESNNSCASNHFLGALYTQAAPGQPASVQVMPTIYGSGDVDVFRATFTENDSSCGCGGFSTDEDYGFTATLTVPSGAGSYELCASMSSCSTTSNCVTVAAGSSGSRTIWKDGCCSPAGCNDSGTGYFTVRGVGTPGFECAAYTLNVATIQGCR